MLAAGPSGSDEGFLQILFAQSGGLHPLSQVLGLESCCSRKLNRKARESHWCFALPLRFLSVEH